MLKGFIFILILTTFVGFANTQNNPFFASSSEFVAHKLCSENLDSVQATMRLKLSSIKSSNHFETLSEFNGFVYEVKTNLANSGAKVLRVNFEDAEIDFDVLDESSLQNYLNSLFNDYPDVQIDCLDLKEKLEAHSHPMGLLSSNTKNIGDKNV